MQPQGLHKRGYIKVPRGLHKMGLHKHFKIFGGLHKKTSLGVTPKKNQWCGLVVEVMSVAGVGGVI